MNYFNLLRELRQEGHYVSLFSSESEWTCYLSCKGHVTIVRRPTPEEAIRAVYLEINPIPRSGAI